MNITLTFALWWALPLLVTLLSIGGILFVTRNDTGMFSAIGSLILMVPALFVSMVAWIIGAMFK